MVKAAFIFPGQGAQYTGMGLDIYNKHALGRRIFEEASNLLDFDLIKVCFRGPLQDLSKTDISQPAILVTSIAILRVFRELNPNIIPQASAGLSLGEYSALVASRSLDFKDAVKLVRQRGMFMEDASSKNPGKMLSIIGLSAEDVEKICQACEVEIANLNCPGQVVVSGKEKNIKLAAELAKEKKAKLAIILDVSGPFHSSFMKEASLLLQRELANITILPPNIPMISNVSAVYENEPLEIKKNLAAQVDHSVRWEDSMKLLIKDGFKNFFEIGPGKVLKGLMRRIDSSVSVTNIETMADIEEVAIK